MTPKEKARELYSNYLEIMPSNLIFDLMHHLSKQCALIAVDEMMEVYASACVAMGMSKEYAEKQQSKYLQEVKQEIEKL